MSRHFIGIDIGGTNVRCGLVTSDGRIVERRKCPSRIDHGKEAFCARLLLEIDALRAVASQHGMSIESIGIGIPGLIGQDGMIHSSVNMKPLEGFNLVDFVEAKTGLPTLCANDANVAALGEQCFGGGKGFSSCMVVTIGTGLGSGLILGDKLWAGSKGFAAEFGHFTVDPEGLACPCGNRGCLEQYVSAGALVRFARQQIANDTACQLDAEKVALMAKQGDFAALSAFDQLGYWLGTALASLINTLNIQAVIIGGGVSASFDYFLPAVKKQMEQRCFPQMLDGVRLEKALLGDDAGLLGGAALAVDGLKTSRKLPDD